MRLRARFSAQSDYDRITGITYQQGSGTLITVQVTAAYAGLSTAGYDLLVPDLSHVAGFDATWALRAGTDVFWIGTRRGGTLGLGQNGVPADGGTARDGVVFGDYTP